jgi:hypothetical protein
VAFSADRSSRLPLSRPDMGHWSQNRRHGRDTAAGAGLPEASLYQDASTHDYEGQQLVEWERAEDQPGDYWTLRWRQYPLTHSWSETSAAPFSCVQGVTAVAGPAELEGQEFQCEIALCDSAGIRTSNWSEWFTKNGWF